MPRLASAAPAAPADKPEGAAGASRPEGATRTGKPEILFLGNGPLATAAVATLEKYFTIVFHAHTKADLEPLLALKAERPELPAVLASFGVILRPDVLAPFEPQGIINIHPSLLPKYRGPAPIEAALLAGDTTLGVSIMKITAEMDAGPVYHQESLTIGEDVSKAEVYARLASAGADWVGQHLFALPAATAQDDRKATFTRMLKKRDGVFCPTEKSALTLAREVRAYAGFPKSKFTFGAEFGGVTCTILRAHALAGAGIAAVAGAGAGVAGAGVAGAVAEAGAVATETVAEAEAGTVMTTADGQLLLVCAGQTYLVIDELQPESRKAMSAAAFINGYRR